LGPNERGNCRVRVNLDGRLITLVYGKPCSVHIDPIEKKPMFHFLPGTQILSIATAGCNLHCKFCQNWEISQANPEDAENIDLPPGQVVDAAIQRGCPSIAYTYSDPMIFYEYARDTSAIARTKGIRNILVTAGYINEKPLRELCKVTDGANVDLKGFTEDFYRDVCGGDLATVLRTLQVIMEEKVYLEITTLIVPTLNDDMNILRDMCKWIVANLGPEVPHHFSRFHPMYLMRNLYPTPAETLYRARRVALEAGEKFVYIGNVPGEYEDTVCPGCGKTVISRMGFTVRENRLRDGKCPDCGRVIPGVWK
jgi:pyruvate formate lyase activating enzyme